MNIDASHGLNRAAATLADSVPLVSPEGWRQSRLHALDRDWPETNCDLDLWIELAQARGLEPEALLGFAVAQDFMVDQFAMLVPPKEELELFYGASIRPLALYGRFEDHFVAQIADGACVVLETDSFYLPDARGVAYRRRHIQSTIAIAAIDPARRTLDYFHNQGFWRLEGEDYDMIVHRPPHLQLDEIVPPHAETIRFEFEPLRGATLREAATDRLRFRLSRAPRRDPIALFGATLATRAGTLAGVGENAFHDWAFHTVRQLGAAFELLGDHLAWLDEGAFAAARENCTRVSSGAKALQFQLARVVVRGRTSDSVALLGEISAARATALAEISAGLDALTSP